MYIITFKKSVKPSQLFNNIPHILHTRSQVLANFDLCLFVQIQETLHHFTIDESERRLTSTRLVAERAPVVEADASQGLHFVNKVALELHQDVLVLGSDVTVKVYCTLHLN